MATITDLISPVSSSATARPVVDTLAAPGKALAATSLTLTNGTNWPTGFVVYISIYETTTVQLGTGTANVKNATTQADYKGILAGTTISSLVLTGGTDRAFTTGATVEITYTSRMAYDDYQWKIAHGNLDGSLKGSAVQAALGLSSSSLNGWNALGYTFSTVTYNGNRSYDCVIAGADLTATLSAGMRLRTTRTTAAPTQATSLNGTNQYWSKTTPAGMTFTDDFVVSAWIKLSSYPAGSGMIASRYNGTSGWNFYVSSTGQLTVSGVNAGAGNFSAANTYQSIPLNRWVHVTAQLDMSTFTASTTTSYFMIDGQDVPTVVSRGGTNPTALVQAGNLEIGSNNGGSSLFPGKIAQVAIFNAKVTQATMRGYISQGLLGTETSNVSAFSFNGNGNDLNTTNANNLTANNGAAATNADSFNGNQADGTISSTLDYGLVQKVVYSGGNTTVTVQVPEGCAIPTSGTVASVVYSSNKAPYGMPVSRGKWVVETHGKVFSTQSGPVAGTWYNVGTLSLSIPTGEWWTRYEANVQMSKAAATTNDVYTTLSTANNSETDVEYTAYTYLSGASGTLNTVQFVNRQKNLSLSAPTSYYINQKTSAPASDIYIRGDQATTKISAENAYL